MFINFVLTLFLVGFFFFFGGGGGVGGGKKDRLSLFTSLAFLSSSSVDLQYHLLFG